ncbi:MAG: ATP-binding protein [candidate division WOR-3 bacterium]
MPDATAVDFSSRALDLGLDAIDPLEVERLRRLIAAKEPGSSLLSLTQEALLERLGILADGRLTIAGLLLLGREEELHRHLPGHEAIYLHMKSDVEYDRRFDSSKPLLALLEQFTQSVEPHNRIFTLKLGLFHFEIPDFPEEVYREALLNAFTHRDYSLPAPVYLRHYPDRLEVSSPGGFCGDVSVANIIGHEPVSRNRLLAEMLQRIRLVERAGMGVKRMFHILLSHGKEPPSYEAGADFVRVTIRSGRTGDAAAIDDNFARFVVKEQQEGRELSLYDLLVLTWLKRNREIDLTEARALLQRSENEVREALSSMVTRGLLEPFGQKKGRVYRLSKTLYARLRKSVSYFLFRRAEAAYAETTIMAYLEDLPGPEERRFITNEIVRTLLRVSPHQAGYLLSGLVRKGKLTLHGRGRAARYYKTRQLSAF